jgi:hypothetical protein
MNFQKQSEIRIPSGRFPERAAVMFSYPTPSVRGAKYPIAPTAIPPIAGHHIQCIGSFSNLSSIQYTDFVTKTDATPTTIPIIPYTATVKLFAGAICGIGNVGSDENRIKCMHAPVMHAIITGKKLFAENSKSSSSIAKRIAANGVPKIAVIPAVAPAAKSIFLSWAVM